MATRYTNAANVEFYFGEEFESSDADNVTGAIEHAEGFIDDFCHRRFDAADYVDVLNGEGRNRLYVRNIPIISVTSIIERDSDDLDFPTGDAEDLTEFFIDNDMGEINWADKSFATGRQNWQISYRAGFDTVPSAIVSAATLMTAALLRGRLTDWRPGLQQVSTSGIAALYLQDTAARSGVIQLLQPWVMSRIV